MTTFLKEFKSFALRGNALDLAVGVVIGAAFNGIVNSLVKDVFTPPLSLLTGGIDFATLSIPIADTGAAVMYGVFLQNVISFVITAFALFLLIKGINQFLRTKDAEPAPPPPKTPEVELLEEIRDLLKTRNA
jgi:large conductance mechanosensitive channel